MAGFGEAVDAVRASSVAVVVVGGSSARGAAMETPVATGAAEGDEMECGEGVDRASLDLAGVQLDLLKALHATGVPLVVVVIAGRPMSIPWIAEHAAALLYAWYPGQEGGHALADILFGDCAPAGRLPISIRGRPATSPCSTTIAPRRGRATWKTRPPRCTTLAMG